MSANLDTPGARRSQAIRDALEDLALALDDLREVRPQINDPALLGRLEAFIAAAGAMLEEHGEEPGPSLPAQARSLRDGITEMAIPSRDPELGRTESLRRLQSAEGLFTARLDRLRNLLPETPATSDAPLRSETGAVGERIEARLQILEASLRALREADRATNEGSVQQTGLINLYIKEAKTEISLARFLAKIGETKLDLGAIQAAAQRLAGLTGEFLAMVAGWAGRVSNWLPPLGERLRQGAAGVLKAVEQGWRAVRWRRARESALFARDAQGVTLSGGATQGPDVSSFEPDPNEVRRRLLAGDAIPAEWAPGITDVDLSETNFAATERLPALAKLRILNLTSSQVSDIEPLATLAKLKILSLMSTNVRDIAPLAGLTNLQHLYLADTQVHDIEALAALANLQSLNLMSTKVRNIAPLAGLASLENLDLTNTQVRDIVPLAALNDLQSLKLARTRVRDTAPLAALANLQILNLTNTQVSDIAPLAGLTNLQSLDLRNTQVSDIAPLAALERLSALWVSSTELAGYAELVRRPGLTIHVEGKPR